MSLWLDVALVLLGLPVVASCAYLLVAALFSSAPLIPHYGEPRLRFRVLVPAHDEASGIAATVQNLLALDYPRGLFDVQVIADNCTDDTAARARIEGALVLERNVEDLRGKGYALHYAFERLPPDVDATVVIDADTVTSPNLLRAFAARVELGAAALQADYAVRNPDASWRTRLMAIALGAFHVARSRTRERFQLSAGLRGNGMCFTRRVLTAVPHEAYSIVEDVEYGIRLAEAGHRVTYVGEAHVYGEMVTSAKAASSQRTRWERGRVALARRHGLRLVKKGFGTDRVLFDLGLDLLVPPLSRVAVLAVGFAAVAWSCALLRGGFGLSRAVSSACVTSVVVYVLRGWSLSGTGSRGLLDLSMAPAYVIWKLLLRVTRSKKNVGRTSPEWVRTTRERP